MMPNPARAESGNVENMTSDERAALWQRRLFEAESGLTRYLGECHGGRDIGEWHRVRGEIFAKVPGLDPPDPEGWQRVFFRAQALMERFLVGRYGHGELQAWAEMNAKMHRHVEPDPEGGPLDPIRRIARQAELYGSEYQVLTGDDSAEVEISHCAIWDYRETARKRDVAITLESPCEYCTHATASNIESKGYQSEYELIRGPSGPGCRWKAKRAPHSDPSARIS